MSNRGLLLTEAEGAELPTQPASRRSRCLCRAFCAVTVLGLLAYTSYLLCRQLAGSPSHQTSSLMAEGSEGESVEPASTGLPQVMNVVGRAPRKVAVHLTASPNSQGKKRVTWRKRGPLPAGVGFKGNGLVVRTPGRYFIYSQVSFYSRGCGDRPVFLSHQLQRLSSSYQGRQTLLSSLTSTCQHTQRGETWFEASYHGAAFELSAGDQIFSAVSPNSVAFVNREAERTYFGLFAL
ncbi:tumor necrosis factor-like [Pristis pectinata]|uniref:tumor necrosis factor-like n=1 Tax=Pristis pectinata TaxID=685728 RepID=UPI00223DCAEF|nr:tumor necrosis factor-like [Pristis pectinata]